MPGYYSEKLSAERLRRCYDLATPAVRRYLRAETDFILQSIRPGDRLLELGCGYGRVLAELSGAALLVGIDTALSSLRAASACLQGRPGVFLAAMDAVSLGFKAGSFDLVICPQNGVSAFHRDPRELMASALRVTAPGGRTLFFSYAPEFWDHRLEWFRIQAAHGLVGEIDEAATGKGEIVCQDGFTATTVSPERFGEIAQGLGRSVRVRIIAQSSLVCEIVAR